MLIRYKLAIGSALLLLNNGNAFAQQDKSSEKYHFHRAGYDYCQGR